MCGWSSRRRQGQEYRGQHQQRLCGAGPARRRDGEGSDAQSPRRAARPRLHRALPDRVQAGGKALAPRSRMEDLYPPIEPAHSGWLEAGAGHRVYFEVCGNDAGCAGPVPARRPRQQQQSRSPPLLRPILLSHRPVRSARLRALHAERRDARQHHRGPARRHRAPAPASGRGALAAVRRILGQHPGAGLCPGSSRSGCAAWSCAGCSSPRDAEVAWYLEGLRRFLPEAWAGACARRAATGLRRR